MKNGKHITIFARLSAVLLTALWLLLPNSASALTSQSLAVPIFTRPDSGTFWNDVTAAGSSAVPFVVANPHDGPGTAAEAPYTNAIAKNNSAGIRTLGYIQTNYQQRPFQAAYNDIDAWYRLYPGVKGVYIDSVTEGTATDACYIAGLYSHIKNVHPNDLVVLAPGTHISQTYEPYGDIFLTAMTDYGSYQNWHVQYPGFEDKISNQNRFWHVIYGVSASNYSSAFSMTRANNAGWTFITDKSTPTPLAQTPSYWQNETSDVGALPASTIPNRGKTTLPRGCISLSASADNTMDTTALKQSTTTSNVTVTDISTTNNSEPTTQVRAVTLPAGVTLASLSGGAGWVCALGTTAACNYGSTIAASSSVKLAVTLQAGCNYGGGDALFRVVNYAGNQWDIKLPVRAPIGCDASTAAGKINKDSTGQVTTLTTQSIEATPDITASTTTTPKQLPKQTTPTSMPFAKVLLIIGLTVALAAIIIAIIILVHRHRRYRVEL